VVNNAAACCLVLSATMAARVGPSAFSTQLEPDRYMLLRNDEYVRTLKASSVDQLGALRNALERVFAMQRVSGWVHVCVCDGRVRLFVRPVVSPCPVLRGRCA
jgi:hypothetical protein